MDRKSIIVLVVCFLALMLWGPLTQKIFPPTPIPLTNAPSATITLTNGATAVAETPRPESIPLTPAVAETPLLMAANTNVPEVELEVTNSLAHYTFTSYGGGLKQVELLRFPEVVAKLGEKRKKEIDRFATLNVHSPNPVFALLGGPEIRGDGVYQLSRTDRGVRAEKALTNGLAIIKNFLIDSNYVVTATVRIENRTAQPVAVSAHQWVAGTATPMGPRDDPTTIGAMWYEGSSTESVDESWFSNKKFLGCGPSSPRAEYRAGASNVVWAAAHNQFFTLALMPKDPAQEIVVRKIELPRPTGEDAALVATNAPAPAGYHTALSYPALVLPPNQGFERQVRLYAGPKEYQTLVKVGDDLKNKVDLIMGYGGFFGFFAKALLLAMNWLHDVASLPYGLAIVVITVIIKLLFWPLTQASTRSMKRMQALQPQMKEIQEKYKEDPVKMNRKPMEFMKENKVSPLGGCLPMLLQIPVFFGFYQMIRSAIELRGASFIWVTDLSKPDTIYTILGWVSFRSSAYRASACRSTSCRSSWESPCSGRRA